MGVQGSGLIGSGEIIKAPMDHIKESRLNL